MTDSKQQRYRFSEAPIWALQRQYYEEEGLRAWVNDQVPQYITSNPMIAASYADIIFGLLQDRASQGSAAEPVFIVELGAGAGRLAYHVLDELCRLRDCAGAELPPFCYVMTDLAMSNVMAWKEHPALQTFIADGLLDFAQFDAVHGTELDLVVAGTTIREGDLAQPVILVANYFFDGIPQELLYVGNGDIYETDVLVGGLAESVSLKPSEALRQITLQYEHRRAPEYEQPSYPYADLISVYREHLEDSHILFPAAGLTCLERLDRLSREGFLLITADKGDHLLEHLKFAEPPKLVFHGSFSLTANYHAFRHIYEQRGSLALFPEQRYNNINFGCIIHLAQPSRYSHARLAYRRHTERFGPDEFYSLKEWVDRRVDEMELRHVLSFWRLGGCDAEFFIQSAKRISSLLPDATDDEKADLFSGIERMWSSYYVMAQRYNLALDAGLILFEMDMYEDSRRYLELSIAADPDEVVSTVYYCLAICCLELESYDEGAHYLRKLLEAEPDHEEAAALLQQIQSL